MFETQPMKDHEMDSGRYVCVIHPEAGCRHSPHITIRSEGWWVKTETMWSSGHADCVLMYQAERTEEDNNDPDYCHMGHFLCHYNGNDKHAAKDYTDEEDYLRGEISPEDAEGMKEVTVPDAGFGGSDMTYYEPDHNVCYPRDYTSNGPCS